MELVRVGDKLISVEKIHNMVEEILRVRAGGLSQAEVAQHFGVDRTFVSRLETVGEVRKGRSIAVIGMPVANTSDVMALTGRLGVDFTWVMTDLERRHYAESRNGIELVNEVMALAGRLRFYDTVILMASNARVRLMEALMDQSTVVPMILGQTPLTRDVQVDLGDLEHLISAVQQDALAGERP